MASFGRWLERQMEREDLNLSGLAAKLGLSHTSVRAWIVGIAEPSAENIPRLARVLHVSIEDVYRALGRLSAKPESDTIARIEAMLPQIRESDLPLVESLVRFLIAREKEIQ